MLDCNCHCPVIERVYQFCDICPVYDSAFEFSQTLCGEDCTLKVLFHALINDIGLLGCRLGYRRGTRADCCCGPSSFLYLQLNAAPQSSFSVKHGLFVNGLELHSRWSVDDRRASTG